MRIQVGALGVAGGVLWGATVFLVGLASLIWPGYGADFLRLVASIYPGYHAGPGFGQVVVGAMYAVVDGFVGGLLLGWLYNVFAGRAAGRPA